MILALPVSIQQGVLLPSLLYEQVFDNIKTFFTTAILRFSTSILHFTTFLYKRGNQWLSIVV